MIDLIGALATILTSIQFIPQAIKAYRTKKLKDISVYSYLMIFAASSLWILYSLLHADIYVLITNLMIFVCALFILTLKILYSNQK